MDLSVNGAAFLRLQEGFVDHAYRDAVGVLTIGVGFTWRSNAFRQWWEKNRPGQTFDLSARMTRSEADNCLRYLCQDEYGKAVNDFLGHDVPPHVFDAMTSVVFNCGAGTLDDRWAIAAKRADYATAARFLETTRVTAKGKKLAGLVRRRKEEGLLISKGIYTGVTTNVQPVAVDPLADGVLVRGERGPAVATLILNLAALGFYTGRLDDVFGFGTEAAVLKFQRANGLKDDGYAGPKTLALIAEKVKAKGPAEPVQRVSPLPSETDKAFRDTMAAKAAKDAPAPAPEAKTGWLSLILSILSKLFKRKPS